jgi:Family of unknown function (DUF6328)
VAEAGGEPGEEERERVNRELIEFLDELKIALPAVQVLFAFFFVLPFYSRFATITRLQKDIYFAAFLSAAAALGLFVAPSAYHRLNFRRRMKERLLITSNHMAIAATVFLAMSLCGAVFLVADVIYRGPAVGIIAGAAAAWFAWFWFGLPLIRRRESGR